MSTTIKDIAAQLGISHSTVSRALRDMPYVNADLRLLIHKTARQMSYRPNRLARGLKGMRTQTVGLLIPDLVNDLFATAATVIQSTLAAQGFHLLLSVSGNDPSVEKIYLRAMREERIEGLIWVPGSNHESVVREYAEEGVPVVEFVRKASARLDGVVADDAGGAETATEHLLSLGHRRIGLVTGQKEVSTTHERLGGYLRALAIAGIEPDERLTKLGMFNRAWGGSAADELMSLDDRPTAIVATSSEIMLGILSGLQHRGISVPQDVSLVGFGDPGWYSIWRPPITSIAFAVQDMATSAVHMLLRRIAGGRKEATPGPVVSTMSCTLIVRESTGSARQPVMLGENR